MRTRQNLLFHTFIGLYLKVTRSNSKLLAGKNGKIVDETKNLIIIENADKKEIKLQKIACSFRFSLDDGSFFDIDGKEIAFRPEERGKKIS